MALIKVKARITTIHLKYGSLKKGDTYEIEEADLGKEVFREVTQKVENPKPEKIATNTEKKKEE